MADWLDFGNLICKAADIHYAWARPVRPGTVIIMKDGTTHTTETPFSTTRLMLCHGSPRDQPPAAAQPEPNSDDERNEVI